MAYFAEFEEKYVTKIEVREDVYCVPIVKTISAFYLIEQIKFKT